MLDPSILSKPVFEVTEAPRVENIPVAIRAPLASSITPVKLAGQSPRYNNLFADILNKSSRYANTYNPSYGNPRDPRNNLYAFGFRGNTPKVSEENASDPRMSTAFGGLRNLMRRW